MKLEICDVSKQYKDKCAVDHANLTLTPGVWGLLGANNCRQDDAYADDCRDHEADWR